MRVGQRHLVLSQFVARGRLPGDEFYQRVVILLQAVPLGPRVRQVSAYLGRLVGTPTGARRPQIRRIFMLQGVLIGIVGSAIGLAVGYTLCYFADKYRWVRLDETVYSLSFVPFEARWVDGLWVAAAAILVSFLATIYPARNATRIVPAEILRYE